MTTPRPELSIKMPSAVPAGLAMLVATLALLGLAACAGPQALEQAKALAQGGQHEQALKVLEQARAISPGDAALRSAELHQRSVTVTQLVQQAETERSNGRAGAAANILARAAAIDPQHARGKAVLEDIERARRRDEWLASARAAEAANQPEAAQQWLQRVLDESPSHPGARALQLKLYERRGQRTDAPVLGPAFRRQITLELRDAPLRNLLEGLARSHGVNFVFDREVRTEAKVSVMLRDVAMVDALRVILNTQALTFKILNDNTLLVYPNTQPKQREHQDLVTRNFYLANADVKLAQTLVRTMAKTRDLYVDDRLNLLVVRDTPEVVRMVESLLAAIDLPEPEVLLEVEVLEISSNRLDEIGLQWPEQVSLGLPGGVAQVPLGSRRQFTASIANPALLATLRESTSLANTLANPRLRARNREKAKVTVGEKLPVFTTSAVAGVGSSVSTAYLDVGLKLEVEPNVQLDNDVVMKVNLEVSTVNGRVAGPQGSVGYQIGTRQASTSLRLRDGETQILAGLIRDEDSKGVSGVPGLSAIPLLGRLFGLHTDQRFKSEIVLLITPRVLRSLAIPDAALGMVASGLEASPGAEPLRLAAGSALSVGMGRQAGVDAAPAPAPSAVATPASRLPPEDRIATLLVATSGQVEPGATAAVTLRNGSDATMRGDLSFDPALLSPAQAGAAAGEPLRFSLPPGAESAVLFRISPAAAGQTLRVSIDNLVALNAAGDAVAAQTEGEAAWKVLRR